MVCFQLSEINIHFKYGSLYAQQNVFSQEIFFSTFYHQEIFIGLYQSFAIFKVYGQRVYIEGTF